MDLETIAKLLMDQREEAAERDRQAEERDRRKKEEAAERDRQAVERDRKMREDAEERHHRMEARLDDLFDEQKRNAEKALELVQAFKEDVTGAVQDLDVRLKTTEENMLHLEQQLQGIRDDCRRQVQEAMEGIRRQEFPLGEGSSLDDLNATANATMGREPMMPGSAKVPAFDGRIPWESYSAQFELLAQTNRWPDNQKALQLALALRGGAINVLSSIDPQERDSYFVLARALQQRYGTQGQPDLAKSKLRSRIQRRDEKLPELAEEVECLTRAAYPEINGQALDIIAMEHFTEALRDDELRKQVLLSHPRNLQEALCNALSIEAILSSKRHPARSVRKVELDSESGEVTCAATRTERGCNPDRKKDELADIGNGMKAILEEIRRLGGLMPVAMRRKPNRLACWKCGKTGHLQAHCKEVEATSVKTLDSGNGERLP